MALTSSGTFRIEPPRLRVRDDGDGERHATWFELYFDLIFVAAVAQLATALARNPTAPVFGRFFGLFTVVAWAWSGYIFYANRYDTDDLFFRLGESGAMLAIAALAVNVHRVMAGQGGTVGFALATAVVRLILVALYIRTWEHVSGQARRFVRTYISFFSFTTALWFVSIAVPEPYRQILWGMSILIDWLAPARAWRLVGGAYIVVSHLTERYGTFFIIVLGESVVATVAGVAGFEFNFDAWVIATTCFVIALCIWWIYFDLADTSVLGRGNLGLIYVYGHLPLLAAVAAFGAGTKIAITHVGHAGLEAGARWALGGGIAVFALSLAAFHLGAEWTTARDPTFISRLVLAALAIVLAAVGDGMTAVAFVLILGAAMIGQLLIEAFTFPTGAATIYTPPSMVESELAGGEA